MPYTEQASVSLPAQVNLDGYALPIKRLKGADPVDSLDVAGKRLGVASAIVISTLIGVNATLTSIDLSSNYLGVESAQHIVEGISASALLTECTMFGNELDVQSAKLMAKVGTNKRIMLFGIKHDQTEANFKDESIGYDD